MRSAGVAWLMDLYGFKVYTLVGGYKKFRNYVVDTFRLPFRFKILGGYTGSGKTETLKILKERSEKVIDLENIAGHKGSAFGNIGLPAQPSQEMFENVLATKLRSQLAVSSQQSANLSMAEDCELQTADCIWLEDESQRIGQVNIPNDLWKTMRRSPVYFLDINFEERLKHLTEEYGGLDKEQVLDAIGRIKEKLGGLNAKMASQLLIEGNIIESFRILLEYYDRAYSKSLHNREGLNSLLHTIESKSITPENANLLVPHPIPEAGIYRMEKL
jgi:tRNA 2-selenouridine synthase